MCHGVNSGQVFLVDELREVDQVFFPIVFRRFYQVLINRRGQYQRDVDLGVAIGFDQLVDVLVGFVG